MAQCVHTVRYVVHCRALPPQDMLRKLSIVGAGTLLPMLVGAGDPVMRVFLVLVVALGWLVVQVRLQPYRLQEVRRGVRCL